jgi:hypothetical protein
MNASDLSGFTGTENYYRYSPLFRNFILTDGTKFLADEAGAYWLMDAIASHVGSYKRDTFAVVNLRQNQPDNWLLTIDDGNGKLYARQEIEFSDFPLESIKLYVCKQEDGTFPHPDMWVILLPSEY